MAEGARNHIRVQLVQMAVSPDISENIRTMEQAVDPRVDLALLPELWNVPYDNELIQASYAWSGTCREAMARTAREKAVWVAGTIGYEGQNMAFVFDETGREVCRYAKTHLMEVHTARHHYTERDVFAPGDRLVSFSTPWGPMGILICYDIRFCEPVRTLARRGIRLLLVCAAFNDQAGPAHWQPLLQCRALENEIWVAAVNPDYAYKNYRAWGHSMIVDPNGQVYGQGPGLYDIDLSYVEAVRQRMPFWKIRRTDLYSLEEQHEKNTNH